MNLDVCLRARKRGNFFGFFFGRGGGGGWGGSFVFRKSMSGAILDLGCTPFL